MYFFRNILLLVLATLSLAPRLFAHEEQVILVGRNAANDIVVDSDFAQPVALPVSIFPGISGYAFGELGIHSTVLDEPADDFFQLSTAADFQFILLAKDPGVEVWNEHGTGYMQTNETFAIGPSPFDTHPVWNITSGTAGIAYSLTLKLRDLNHIYPDSEPFVLSFTPVEILYSLEIKQVGSLHATLSWTTNAVGWELQSASTMTTTNWNAITNVPSIAGTNFSLSISTSETQQFFRLRKQ